jgi:endonuclease/exonuclease/phosphatase family metal-dependent hydrolase
MQEIVNIAGMQYWKRFHNMILDRRNLILKGGLGVSLLAASTCIPAGSANAKYMQRQAGKATELRVMTYNIRLDTPTDGLNDWAHRREMLTSQIYWLRPDIFGLQEVVFNQKQYIANAFRFDFTLVGVGRDDGKDAGESSPIGYNTHRFKLMDSGTFWLSPTPDVPSKGWDAAYPRVATWARLRTIKGGKMILVMNTHWDHVGVEARKQSALQVKQWLIAHRKAKDHVIVIGDFNAEPDSEPLAILTDLKSPVWLRSAALNSTTHPFGPKGTFNDFKLVPEAERTIDHILVGGQKGGEIWINRYAVIAQNLDGRMISDHYPVLADLGLN